MGHVAEQFANSWLSRYPRLNRCINDNGKEFVGSEFIRLLAPMRIKDVCTAVWNPQSNVICECTHQTIGDILQVILHTNPPTNRCSVSTPIQTTSGELVYRRDMIMDIFLIANLSTIWDG